jgi:hypothetical protein
MTAYWVISAEPRGLVLTIEAMIDGADKTGWSGRVATLPFEGISTTGHSHDNVRRSLAAAVLAAAAAGAVPVPAGQVSAVRVMSTSAAEYTRGSGQQGPVIAVPAVADRDAVTWCAATITAAGPLSGQASLGDTLAMARDILAETLMIALEIGIDGLPASWSGIRLLTTTRKTYPVTSLPGIGS